MNYFYPNITLNLENIRKWDDQNMNPSLLLQVDPFLSDNFLRIDRSFLALSSYPFSTTCLQSKMPAIVTCLLFKIVCNATIFRFDL